MQWRHEHTNYTFVDVADDRLFGSLELLPGEQMCFSQLSIDLSDQIIDQINITWTMQLRVVTTRSSYLLTVRVRAEIGTSSHLGEVLD